MNREIKFRAWHIEKKKWFGLFLLDQSGDLYQDEDQPFKISDYILEQFTGLTDKNGTEDWEHDIVEIIVGKFTYQRTIEFRDGAFMIQVPCQNSTDPIGNWFYLNQIDHINIGNINEQS